MSRKLLVVDDEMYILNILDFTLGSEGFEVITAANGEEALRKVNQLRPDLVVLDVMMPKVDGFEVCRAIKSKTETSHIPVILLTARDRAADRKKGEEVRCDAYMTKPFNPQKLVERIRELIGSPASD
jgi:two-component system alkaline phosphatase synthesis response regulator PhoP